ncbi:MAG: tRNA-uridine 2-sulfurtransferase [Candidatus Cloacimonadota bacterium]|nr:tRNA-uridine 2-sulfurtransferase [Candidatus Cloacimonadota bacterium]
MNKNRCIALFSGGLDSTLSVKYMEKLGYEVIPVFFETPFFTAKNALEAAAAVGIDLHVHDISQEHMQMLLNPRYGYGKNMNPCIDCHGLMFAKAAQLLEEYDAAFLISGEVLGQRPMSQRFDAMNAVRNASKVKDIIIRPLSQKLLPDTKPIRAGWVDKEKMLALQGRGRSKQIEMAKEWGIHGYQSPGGGCLLTDKVFSKRLKDLIQNQQYNLRNIQFLKVGRHFRLTENCKLIVGKTSADNKRLSDMVEDEVVLKTKEYPGPLGVLQFNKYPDDNEIELAASILLDYNNKAAEKAIVSYGKNYNLNKDIEVKKNKDKKEFQIL